MNKCYSSDRTTRYTIYSIISVAIDYYYYFFFLDFADKKKYYFPIRMIDDISIYVRSYFERKEIVKSRNMYKAKKKNFFFPT